MSIRDEMMSGRLYDASNGELLEELLRSQEMCQDYNALRITDLEGRTAMLHKLIGKVGKNFIVNPPFFCDYGSNIEVGDNVFINAYCVILDEAKVRHPGRRPRRRQPLPGDPQDHPGGPRPVHQVIGPVTPCRPTPAKRLINNRLYYAKRQGVSFNGPLAVDGFRRH